MSYADTISADLRPTKSIIICSTGRSGSTLLSRTLSSLDCLGKPIEFFRSDMLAKNGVTALASELYPYLARVYSQGQTANGVFSAKLHWDHLGELLKIARTDPALRSHSDSEILSCLFPNPKFIFIRRQNLVSQAISMEISKQTGVYLILKDRREKKGAAPSAGSPGGQPLSFRPLNIYRYKQGVAGRNRSWQSFFQQNHLPFFEVVYEDLVKDFDRSIRQTVAFCDVDLPQTDREITRATKKQGNQVNERWLRYYQLIPEGLLAAYSEARSYARSYAKSCVRRATGLLRPSP
ncbi:MAG: Stf0 family sulfotransferase [Cyanobacteria bacterium P01_H01_bin.26]